MWLRAVAGIALLVTMGAGAAAGVPAARFPARWGGAAQGQLVIAKEGTGLYHWPGCPVVQTGEGVIAMNRGQADARGFKPHPDCDPSKAPAVPVRSGPGAGSLSKPAAPPSVFVDASGTYYHRERCGRLAKVSKKVVLDAATVKKYWPCPACKPPIRPKKS